MRTVRTLTATGAWMAVILLECADGKVYSKSDKKQEYESGKVHDSEIRRFGNPLNYCGEENLHSEGTEPCDEALEADDEDGPFLTEFATDGGYGCYTWSIEQTED